MAQENELTDRMDSRAPVEGGYLQKIFTRNLQISELSQEPVRSILRKAGKVLNVRGKQFRNLVDVTLSDEECEPSPPRRFSGPPTSVTLKRAFGIPEPRKSGQDLMDFFGDRWLEFYVSSGSEKRPQGEPCSSSKEPKTRPIQPVLENPIFDLRRPWFAALCDEGYDPPDPARPPPEDGDFPPPSPDPARFSCSW